MKKLSIFFAFLVFVLISLFIYYFIRYQIFGNLIKGENSECMKVDLFYSDASGLSQRSKVKLSGVDIGNVENIELKFLDAPTVKVSVCIYPEYFFIPIDSSFVVYRNIITQDAIIEVDYGIEPTFLKENDVSYNTRPAMNIEKLLYKLKF